MTILPSPRQSLPPAPIPRRPAGWRWWIAGLLLLATIINYMDRVTLANASIRVTEELNLTNAQYGTLELGFGWAFALGSLLFGFMADRVNVYFLYPVVLALWSAAGMATGLTASYDELLVCRFALGFFEAGHWPCALRTTFATFEERDRTMGNSILQSGASIGAVLAPQIMKVMMTDDAGSWRLPFIVIGATGLLWIALWLLALRPRDLRAPSPRAGRQPEQTLLACLLSRRFAAVAILIIGAQTVWHVFRVWLVKFLHTGRGYSETAALNFSSLYYIATDIGCLLAGAAALWLVRRFGHSPHRARRTVYTCACGFTSCSLLLPSLGHGWLLLAVLLLIGAGALALFPCFYSFVQEISSEHVGKLTGLLGMWVWATTSPVHTLFGSIADRTGRYDIGLLAAGITPWLGVLALRFLWTETPGSLQTVSGVERGGPA